jgi:hypothetical protein
LDFLAEILLADKISSSSKLKPPVSGRRKKHRVMQGMFIASQKKADLAPKLHEIGETNLGAIWPTM